MSTLPPVVRLYRRIRYGQPIIVVSGLPRSGTSMAMKMLEAGGVPILTDGVRAADESNPFGYYEFEPVKHLDRNGDPSWLAGARGKAVKIISFLLTYLPESFDYRVVFLQRDLEEVLASQNKMLMARGEAVDPDGGARTLASYREHLDRVHRFLVARPCFDTLHLDYGDAVRNPRRAAERLNAFLGGRLDVERMAAVADPALYRNRSGPRP